MARLLRLDEDIVSAETIVTARVHVEYDVDSDPEVVYFSVVMTAPASHIHLFLIPYSKDENATVEIDILDTYQPLIHNHDENLKWINRLAKETQ